MSLFSFIRFSARTDVGRKRKNNEDAYGVFPKAGVFCVADGMGGGDDGEIASAAVVKAVEDAVRHLAPDGDGAYAAADVADSVESGLAKASKWIFNRAADKKLSGCGSTFVGVVFDAVRPGTALALHAGDSRLYLLHGRSIRQITRDHSAAEMMGVKDEKKINPLFRSMVMNAIGIRPKADAERTPFKVCEGDRIIVCSDGLSRMVPDKKIASISRAHGNVDAAADALVAAALEAGGIDNVTLVIMEVGALPAPAKALEVRDSDSFVGEDADTVGADGDDTSTATDSRTVQTLVGPLAEMRNAGEPAPAAESAGRHGLRKAALLYAVIAVALVLAAAIAATLFLGRRTAGGDVESAEMSVPSEPVNVAVEPVDVAVELDDVVADSHEPEVVEEKPGEPVCDEIVIPEAPVPESDIAPEHSEEPALPDPAVEPVAEQSSEPASAVVAEPEPDVQVRENLADACSLDNVSQFLSALRRRMPRGESHYDFDEQSKRFAGNARFCARMRTEESRVNVTVDVQFLLQSASAVREAIEAGDIREETAAWLADWAVVVCGDAASPDVQEACARLIVHASEACLR